MKWRCLISSTLSYKNYYQCTNTCICSINTATTMPGHDSNPKYGAPSALAPPTISPSTPIHWHPLDLLSCHYHGWYYGPIYFAADCHFWVKFAVAVSVTACSKLHCHFSLLLCGHCQTASCCTVTVTNFPCHCWLIVASFFIVFMVAINYCHYLLQIFLPLLLPLPSGCFAFLQSLSLLNIQLLMPKPVLFL